MTFNLQQWARDAAEYMKNNPDEDDKLDMLHSILSGGGELDYRVDKAIRKIEDWKKAKGEGGELD